MSRVRRSVQSWTRDTAETPPESGTRPVPLSSSSGGLCVVPDGPKENLIREIINCLFFALHPVL
jgi:hypothetical protein